MRSLGRREQDTSFVCVADRWGNAFAATPSDSAASSPLVPGVGCLISSRGSQSWLERDHPSALAPGKRPRLTPCPTMVFSQGKLFLVLGTPGGDVQPQAMLQVLVNTIDYGMELQTALEADRAYTYSAPDSFWPHQSHPGLIRLDPMLPVAAMSDLSSRGHRAERLSPWERHQQSSVCAVQIVSNPYGILGGADSRRESYAIGW
ncbi:MAG: gamma-glutamyltransferase [bacterium]